MLLQTVSGQVHAFQYLCLMPEIWIQHVGLFNDTVTKHLICSDSGDASRIKEIQVRVDFSTTVFTNYAAVCRVGSTSHSFAHA